MIRADLEGVEFVVANTDAQALGQSMCERHIQLGPNITQGLGAGSRPDVGRAAADEAQDEILEALISSNIVFITAGMGVLEIGPRLEGHLPKFPATQTHLSRRFYLAVKFLGLCRNVSSS